MVHSFITHRLIYCQETGHSSDREINLAFCTSTAVNVTVRRAERRQVAGVCRGVHITSVAYSQVAPGPQMHAAIFAAKVADAQAQQLHTAHLQLFANSCF
jgi:hypothetical protein